MTNHKFEQELRDRMLERRSTLDDVNRVYAPRHCSLPGSPEQPPRSDTPNPFAQSPLASFFKEAFET
jgi:hypothetical protein